MIKPVAEWYIGAIYKKEKDKGKIDRLAFIEKKSGSIGARTLMGCLNRKTKKNSVIVRIKRRLMAGAIKGEPIKSGERIVLISDVVISGEHLLKAVKIIEHFGGKVLGAVVLVNQMKPEDEKFLPFPLSFAIKVLDKKDLEQQPIKKYIEKIIKRECALEIKNYF